MKTTLHSISALVFSCAIFSLWQCSQPAPQETAKKGMTPQEMVDRGRYLVNFGSCNDCHSPKNFSPQGVPIPDETRLLSGHPANSPLVPFDASLAAPGKYYLGSADLTAWIGPWGISYTANLTPDTATGLGGWSEETFRNALRKGKHMGSDAARPILPPMPWMYINQASDEDLNSILAYLKTLKPISNRVPDPVSPAELASMAKGTK